MGNSLLLRLHGSGPQTLGELCGKGKLKQSPERVMAQLESLIASGDVVQKYRNAKQRYEITESGIRKLETED